MLNPYRKLIALLEFYSSAAAATTAAQCESSFYLYLLCRPSRVQLARQHLAHMVRTTRNQFSFCTKDAFVVYYIMWSRVEQRPRRDPRCSGSTSSGSRIGLARRAVRLCLTDYTQSSSSSNSIILGNKILDLGTQFRKGNSFLFVGGQFSFWMQTVLIPPD